MGVRAELLPQDFTLEIEQLTRSEAMKAARFLASVVGSRMHARRTLKRDVFKNLVR
jgi:hypothetical protein